MQTRPDDLTDEAIAATVRAAWTLPVVSATYAPVGFGSHHWMLTDTDGTCWFASVDVLPVGSQDAELGRLQSALTLAVAAHSSGRSFVVAPLATVAGEVLVRLDGGYALALYPYVEGRTGSFSDLLSPADGADVVELLCALHATETPPGPVDRMEVIGRTELEQSLRDLIEPAWQGPYGGPLRVLLRHHADDVRAALEHHDALVADAGPQKSRRVLTHGEPHPGNLIRTASEMALVDWDTALLAPPERDVWLVDARTGGAASAAYVHRSGRALVPELLARYELAWALADVADFVPTLRQAVDQTADTAWSWEALCGTIGDLPWLLDELRSR